MWQQTAEKSLSLAYLEQVQRSLYDMILKSRTDNLRIGVPTTSQILTADSQKLNLSTLRQVSFSVCWLDKPTLCASSAQLEVYGTIKINIFEILAKICLKYVSASSIWWFFISGHPTSEVTVWQSVLQEFLWFSYII